MELIGPDYVTDTEREMTKTLERHPFLKEHLTRLLNGYRELVMMYVENNRDLDHADALRSVIKKDNALRRIGIPVTER